MKKFLIGLLVLVGLAVGAVFVGPSLVDWESYKPEIAAAAFDATGRELAIDGDIGLSVLPAPTLSVEGLRFANAAGGSAPDMATLDSLDVRVALFPLLLGKIKVESVTLVRPTVLLERLADGGANWEFAKSGARSEGEAPPEVELELLRIEDGTIVYRDAAGNERKLERLGAEVTAGSLKGPFRAAGSIVLRGLPATFEAQAGRLEEGRPAAVDLAVTLPETGAELGFAGELALDPAGTGVTGTLRASGESLARLLAAVTGGTPATGLVAEAFSLTSEIEATPRGANLRDLALKLGELSAAGAIEIAAGPPIAAKVILELGRLDLDKLMESSGGGAGAGAPAAFALPEGIVAEFEVTAPRLDYKRGAIENVALAAKLEEGALALTEFSALLPGGSLAALDGTLGAADGRPRFAGSLRLASDNLRGLLDWLQVTPAGVSAERLRKASFAAKVTATPAQVDLSDIDLALDSTRIAGGIAVALPGTGGRKRPAFGIGLTVDRLDLAGYVPARGAAEQPGKGLPLAALAPLAGFDANLALRVGSLTYHDETAKGISLDGTIQDGRLTLRELGVRDFAGGGGKASGTVEDLAGRPRFDLGVDLAVKDATRMLRFAGLPDPPKKLGAFKLAGKLAGGAEDVAYDIAFSVAGIGAEGGAKGKAVLGAGLPRIDSVFVLKAREAGPLLAIAGLPGAGAKLGALALTGKAASGADDLAYEIELTLAGIEGRAALSGKITSLSGQPRVDTRLDIAAKRPAALLAALGLAPGVKPGVLSVAGTLTGGADRMNLDLSLGGFGGEAAVKGEIAAAAPSSPASFDLDLGASHPEAGELLAAFGAGKAKKLGPFKLVGSVMGTPTAASISGLEIAIGAARIEGELEATLAGRPRVTAAFSAGTLDLDALMGPAPSSPAKAERWSNEPLELGALDIVDGEAELAFDTLTFGGNRFERLRAKLALADGTLTIRELSAGAFGGAIELTGELAGRGVPALAGKFAAKEVRIEQAMKGGTIARQVSGPVSVEAEVAGSGVSMAQLARSLRGEGSLGGTIKIASKGEQLAGSLLLGLGGQELSRLTGVDARNPLALVNEAFTLFVGSVNALSGNFAIEDGVLHTDDTALSNDRASAFTVGDLDIAAWTMNTVTDVARTGAEPYLTIGLAGPMDGPNVKVSGTAAAAAGTAGTGLLGGALQQLVPGAAPESATGTAPGTGGLLQQLIPGAAPEPEPASEEPEPAPAAPGAAGIEPGAEPPPGGGLEQFLPQLFQQ